MNRTNRHVPLEPIPVLLRELDYMLLSDGSGICLPGIALCSLIGKD